MHKFQYCQKVYELHTAHSGLLSRQSTFMLSQIFLLWTKSPHSLTELSFHIPLPVFFTSFNAHCRNAVLLQGAIWANCSLLIPGILHCFQEEIEPFHRFTQKVVTLHLCNLGLEMCKCIIFASKASPLRSVSCCAHFTFSGSAQTFHHLLAVRKRYVLCTILVVVGVQLMRDMSLFCCLHVQCVYT